MSDRKLNCPECGGELKVLTDEERQHASMLYSRRVCDFRHIAIGERR